MSSKAELLERLSDFDSKCQEVSGSNDDRSLDLSGLFLDNPEYISHFLGWLNRTTDSSSPTDINLSNCDLSDSSIQSILKSIMYSTNLQSLDLSHNHMSHGGAVTLLDVLRRSKRLECINIFGNDVFNDSSVKCKHTLEELVSQFQNSSTLRSTCGCKIFKPSLHYKSDMNLSQNGVDEEVELIIVELKKNMDLKELSLDVGKFSRSTIWKLLDAIAKNNTLLSLTIHNLRPSMLDPSNSDDVPSNLRALTISHPHLKSLGISFQKPERDNEIFSVQLAECLSWLKSNFILGSKLTTVQLENLSSGGSSGWIEELQKLLDSNRTISHIALLQGQLNEAQLDNLFNALSRNEVIRLIQLDDLNMSVIEAVQAKLKDLVLLRSTPLLLRLGSSREISFKDINGRQCGTEWQVGDQVEALVDDDSWIKSRVIAISDDLKYGIAMVTGPIKTNIRSPLLRKPDGFVRECVIQKLFSTRSKTASSTCSVGRTAQDNKKSGNIDLNSNKTNQTAPYFFGQRVYARCCGDSRWCNGTIVKIARCERSSHGNGDGQYYLLDIELDDGFLIQEVEEHFVSIVPMEESASNYDVGIFQRGDYVEMYKAAGNATSSLSQNSFVWRRGRVAFDKKNGCYDLRFENGQDEPNIRGRYLRHHFRSRDKVDIRLLGSDVWLTGKILSADKNGTYQVAYDSDAMTSSSMKIRKIIESNDRIKFRGDGPMEEMGVSVNRLMPHGRSGARQKSKQAASFIFHQVSSIPISQPPPQNHSIDLNEDNSATPRFNSISLKTNQMKNDSDHPFSYHEEMEKVKIQETNRRDTVSESERANNYQRRMDRNYRESTYSDSKNGGSLVENFEQLHLCHSIDDDATVRSTTRLQVGSRVYTFDEQTKKDDLFLVESINPDRSLNVKNVKGKVIFDVNAHNVIEESEYLKRKDGRNAEVSSILTSSERTNDKREFLSTSAVKTRSLFKVGSRVECNTDNSINWHHGVVVQNKGNGLYAVILDDEDNERPLPQEALRPIRSSIENSFNNRSQYLSPPAMEYSSTPNKYQSRNGDPNATLDERIMQMDDFQNNNSTIEKNFSSGRDYKEEILQHEDQRQPIVDRERETPFKILQWKPEESKKNSNSNSELREGTRVEYMRGNRPDLKLQGCIQRIDHSKGLCELLLDDGTVVEGVNPNLLNPIKKGLMRSPKPIAPAMNIGNFAGNGNDGNMNQDPLILNTNVRVPSTPQPSSRSTLQTFMSPDQVSVPVVTSTPMLASNAPAGTPFRPPLTLRSTITSPRAGTMLNRTTTTAGGSQLLLGESSDSKSNVSSMQSKEESHGDSIRLGLNCNITNLFASPTVASNSLSTSCPFFFYLTVNQPKNNDLFHFVVEVIVPSVFVLSCSHYVVNHFHEPLTLRDHYFIEIPMRHFVHNSRKILVPMFLSILRDQSLDPSSSQTAGPSSQSTTSIPGSNQSSSVLISRIEQEPQLVQVFLYHQYALIGFLECNLTGHKDGLTSIEAMNLTDVGILDASMTFSYQTSSYYQVLSQGMNTNNGSTHGGQNQLHASLMKSTNEFSRNFHYNPQVHSMMQLSSHHLTSIVSKKMVNVLLTIDDVVLKFPSMERLLDSYPLLFEVMNKILSTPGHVMVLSIAVSKIFSSQQRRCLLAFLQSMNQSSPWPRNKLAVSLVFSPKSHFADLAQCLHFPIQRNSSRSSYWKNQTQSNNLGNDYNSTSALLDQQVRLLNITHNLQSLAQQGNAGIIPSFLMLMPFDNTANGSTSPVRDRARMGQFNIPLLDVREYLFHVLSSMSKHGKSTWYLNTSGDPFFGTNQFHMLFHASNSGSNSLSSNGSLGSVFEDKASMWARPVRLDLTWNDLLVFCPIVKFTIMTIIVQRLLLVDPNISHGNVSPNTSSTIAPNNGGVVQMLQNLTMNKVIPSHMNDVHLESLASYLVLLEFFDIIEDTFHRYHFSLFNDAVNGQGGHGSSNFIDREDVDEYRHLSSNNSSKLLKSQSSKAMGIGPSGASNTWHAIVYDISQQMLQNHDLFSYSFSGSSSFQSSASYKANNQQRQQQLMSSQSSASGNSWIMNYIVSNTILICERQCPHYKFFSPAEFASACYEVKCLLDSLGDSSVAQPSMIKTSGSDTQQTWTNKTNGAPMISQVNANHSPAMLINWLREADLFSVTFIEKGTKDLLYRRFFTSHVYDKHFRDWLHVLRQKKQPTLVSDATASMTTNSQLTFDVVDRNANEREITVEVSYRSLVGESTSILTPHNLSSNTVNIPTLSSRISTNVSSSLATRFAEDDIAMHLTEEVGILDPMHVSTTRDVLVHHGCNNWKDFLDLMEIIYSTTASPVVAISQGMGNFYHDSIRKFLQEEMQLPLLIAMKLANHFLSASRGAF